MSEVYSIICVSFSGQTCAKESSSMNSADSADKHFNSFHVVINMLLITFYSLALLLRLCFCNHGVLYMNKQETGPEHK